MKIVVCKTCRQSNMGRDSTDNKATCLTCLGTEFEGIEVNVETAKCIYCGRVWGFVNMQPDFYSANDNTYYCGCRGWD